MEFQHELIIPNEGLPFKIFLFEGGRGNYIREKHWHTSIEIFAVLEGELLFYINNEKYPLHAGELLIVNANEIHSVNALKENKTAVIQIPLRQFENYFTAQQFIRFEGGIHRETDSENPSDRRLISLVQRLYNVYTERRNGYDFRTISLYYELLYLMVTQYRVTEVEEKELRHNRHLSSLSRITTYMREHYREDLKLSDLAETFGYSDAYLSRMFREYAKVNFKTYLQDIRMAYACRDLLNTDHTIGQIAMDNGFCSSRGFAKDFKKRYGILPSQIERRGKSEKNIDE
ncbi:MAG: helix-turn-helix domain-containing protein [Blautia sp.]|uniref:helix-turn-helix transcriptional regulator n=1 Tax=Blautia sp. TaxID=1955243 RepID=UPI003992BA67